MIKAKAKDVQDWKVWHYGVLQSEDTLISDGRLVKIIPRTVCKCTGLKCHGKDVYENDWLTSMGAGEKHSFLVVLYKNEYRAFEDEENSCDLANLFLNETCRIIGNIYD